MADDDFDNCEGMARDFDIEGKTGMPLTLPNGHELQVLCASEANPRWRAQAQKMTAELNRLSNQNVSNERVRLYMAAKYAELCVIGWKNVKKQGVEVPFSVEACTSYLRKYADAYRAVQRMVNDDAHFRAGVVVEVAGTLGE